MRTLLHNPAKIVILSDPETRKITLEEVTAQALRASAARLADNDQLPLVMTAQQDVTLLVGLTRDIRSNGFLGPILILGQKLSGQACSALLFAGADDVVTGPLETQEFLARVAAINRRRHGIMTDHIQVGELEFFLDGRHPQVGGHVIQLSAREYDILRHLVMKRGRVVTKSAIYDALYALCAMPPFEKIIEVYICRIRAKINKASKVGNYIETVPGRGYRLRLPDAIEC